VAGSYGGRRRPSPSELISVILLAIIGLWGVWFGIQALIALWWPLNVVYAVAGAIVATISALVALALFNR
jgi:divalent metal cation (Fe/Co/Zn/Cd) transporter